jgi:hypothetical protein
MSSCPKCGARAEGGSTCPRCGSPLPADRSATALSLASGIFGAVCGISASIGLIVDYSKNGAFTWSRVGLLSCALAWMLLGFPLLSYRRPRIFLPVMATAPIAYLWVLEIITGGSWFLPLALPIALAGIGSAAFSVILCAKARRRGPNIAAFILFGGTLACIAVEIVVSLRLRGSPSFTWSAIVAVSALPLAALLLGIQHRLRQRS